MKREENLARLRTAAEPFDVLIIGGGATGLGAAVDAASRGYRTALIERHDFAKGTSSRSTKLVHGGVRYLRQGNVSLVREALHERGCLARNAPHLVSDLAFVIPTYHWWEGPFYGIGMKVYDRLAGKLGLAPSRILSREETIRRIPTIETDHLTGGVVYHDGQFDDARLAIHLAATAASEGAVLVNYCACEGFTKRDGRITGLRVQDHESGAFFEVAAKVVINATGVFVDAVRQQDDPQVTALVEASQGIHFVLPKRFLPGDAAIMIPKTADGRVLFAVPWHDCVIVGTTDTPGQKITGEPRALAEERAFVFSHAKKYLATDPTADDVLSIYAGLRPLVKKTGAGSTAALSRDHTIVTSASGLITVTGGKWTTYRRMAQDVVDHAVKLAALPKRACITENLKLHGWRERKSRAKNLRVYGSDGKRMKALLAKNPEWSAPLHARLPYQQVEVIWAAREEMARTVEDVLARRTRALLLDARASIEAAPQVARLLAAELGRDPAWVKNQIAAYETLARGYVFTDAASGASAK